MPMYTFRSKFLDLHLRCLERGGMYNIVLFYTRSASLSSSLSNIIQIDFEFDEKKDEENSQNANLSHS